MNRHRVGMVGVAAVLGSATLACGSGGTSFDETTPPTTPAPSSSTMAFIDADVAFAQMMIPHHRQAVDMASLAESRSQDPEVKQLAAVIKSAQQPEIDTMMGWLRAWGWPTTPPPSAGSAGHGGHGAASGMMTPEDMNRLAGAQGREFDRMFVEMMIIHHIGAIEMAQDETVNGLSRDAIDLAKAIIRTQTEEVTTLQRIVDRL
jgi:uncharacterized protein (DUF305 family)